MGNSCIKSDKKVHVSVQTEELTNHNDFYNQQNLTKQNLERHNLAQNNIFEQKKINPVFESNNQFSDRLCRQSYLNKLVQLNKQPARNTNRITINQRPTKNISHHTFNEQPINNVNQPTVNEPPPRNIIDSSINEQPTSDTTLLNFGMPIINWVARNKTVKYHWWPMLEKRKGDYINNLFARMSGLDKYDSLFNTKSIEYQREHYCIPID